MALVPHNDATNSVVGGNSLRFPPLPGKDGRCQLQTDDSELISQVLEIDISLDDDRPYDPDPISLKHILQAAQVILSHVTKPDIHSDVLGLAVSTGAYEDSLERHAITSSLNETYGIPISIFLTISGKLFTKWPNAGEDDHKKKMAMGILYAVQQYDWQEKVVLALGTFAVKNGEFWLVAQLYTTYALAKDIGKLEQLTMILELAQTVLKPEFDAYNDLVNAVLKVTKLIIQLQELRHDPQTTSEVEYATNSTDAHIASAVYWTIWSLVVAASLFLEITSKVTPDYLRETGELSFSVHMIESVRSDLEEAINSLHTAIQRKKDDEALAAIASILETPHVDNIKPLNVLFHKDGQPSLIDCYRKRRVNISVLKRKVVVLFLTDLDILHQNEYMIVQQMYMEKRHEPTKPESQYEVVWMPIADTWTEVKYEKFETIRNAMEWYSIYLPSVVSPTVIRYIRNKWNFEKKPLLVVMDPQGKIVHTNAVHMMCVFGSRAFPFNKNRENLLWEEENWRIELLADSIDENLHLWFREGKHICLYGGEDIDWIRNFTKAAKIVASEAGILLELLYVGKCKARDRAVKNIMRIVQDENLSHTIEWHLIWFFWTRLESMWESKGHQLEDKLKRLSSQLRNTDHLAIKNNDAVMQGIISMLSFGSSDHGWAVIGTGSGEMSTANGAHMLKSLGEFNAWKTRHIELGFTPALNEYLAGVHQQAPDHCSIVMLPVTGLMPETVACAECGRPMERFEMFRCCTD